MNCMTLVINTLSQIGKNVVVQYKKIKEVGVMDVAHEGNSVTKRKQSPELVGGLSEGMQRVISPKQLYCGSEESPQYPQ